MAPLLMIVMTKMMMGMIAMVTVCINQSSAAGVWRKSSYKGKTLLETLWLSQNHWYRWSVHLSCNSVLANKSFRKSWQGLGVSQRHCQCHGSAGGVTDRDLTWSKYKYKYGYISDTCFITCNKALHGMILQFVKGVIAYKVWVISTFTINVGIIRQGVPGSMMWWWRSGGTIQDTPWEYPL